MTKATNKWLTPAGIGTIIAFLGLLYYLGFFNSPKIVYVKAIGSDCICDSYLQQNQTEFDLSFANYGTKDTILCVSLDSGDLNFSKSKDCLFLPPTGQPTKFEFKIIPVDSFQMLQKADLNITYEYDGFLNQTIITGPFCCSYNRSPMSSTLELAKCG